MDNFVTTPRQQAGVSMIEVLVSLLILLVGLLGLAGLQVQAQRSEMESYQRVQALILLQDMAGRINANRKVAATGCYSTGSGFLGTSASVTPACTATPAALATQAVQDMNDWSSLLTGAAETAGGTNVGAMVGARGCITYDDTTQTYFISVAWQGLGKTAAPPSGLDCAQGQYGDDAQRRVVSTTLRIANLSAP